MAGEYAGSATVKETAEVIEGNCRNKHHRVLSMDMFNPFGERNAATRFIAGDELPRSGESSSRRSPNSAARRGRI
jgi:hypothetical protein